MRISIEQSGTERVGVRSSIINNRLARRVGKTALDRSPSRIGTDALGINVKESGIGRSGRSKIDEKKVAFSVTMEIKMARDVGMENNLFYKMCISIEQKVDTKIVIIVKIVGMCQCEGRFIFT